MELSPGVKVAISAGGGILAAGALYYFKPKAAAWAFAATAAAGYLGVRVAMMALEPSTAALPTSTQSTSP